MMQIVLVMITDGAGFNSDGLFWNYSRQHNDSEYEEFEHPYLALQEGWKLLVPPITNNDKTWEWWFTKEI